MTCLKETVTPTTGGLDAIFSESEKKVIIGYCFTGSVFFN